MPIRINLLAESQAAEELRRHDPVKRVLFAGALLVALMLVWSSSVQLEVMLAKRVITEQQNQIEVRTNEFSKVQSEQKSMAQLKDKLDALDKLARSRFLQGNLLNALQMINVDGVRLTRIRMNQSYTYNPGSKPRTSNGHTTPGQPASVTEKIDLSLDARDSSSSPGDQVNKFKEAVADNAFFKSILNRTNGVQLVYLSPPQTSQDGKPFVLFTLDCTFPEATR